MSEITVTQEQVNENMQDVIVRTLQDFEKPCTYVTVRMKNGFTLRESTTCVDPANYDEEIGKKICLEKIEDKVWFLLGYALQDKVANTVNSRLLDEDSYKALMRLGILDTSVRSYNRGASDYSRHIIQPWSIWQDYNLNPWDADIVKRILRTKQGDSRRLDYEKIIHICEERIRQIDMED